jgi:hypothetical protein
LAGGAADAADGKRLHRTEQIADLPRSPGNLFFSDFGVDAKWLMAGVDYRINDLSC